MFGSFGDELGLRPYAHVPAEIDRGAKNDALAYGAARSNKMDWSEYDRIDDFALNEMALHYSVNGGAEKTVKLLPQKGVKTSSGKYVLALEDYKLAPGDLISLYADAKDARVPARPGGLAWRGRPSPHCQPTWRHWKIAACWRTPLRSVPPTRCSPQPRRG